SAATDLVRDWEAAGEIGVVKKPDIPPIAEAVERFFDDLAAQKLSQYLQSILDTRARAASSTRTLAGTRVLAPDTPARLVAGDRSRAEIEEHRFGHDVDSGAGTRCAHSRGTVASPSASASPACVAPGACLKRRLDDHLRPGPSRRRGR